MKTCSNCNIEKPVTEFNKQNGRKDGLRSQCKSCLSDYRSANKNRTALWQSEYYAKNKDRISASVYEYRSKNKQIIELRRSENKEKIARQLAEYRSKNRKRISDYYAEWRLKNLDMCAQRQRNRRARKINAEGTHSLSDVCAIFESQRGLCANCHAQLISTGLGKFHVDHIVPLSRGGANWPSNLQCLCPACNLRKSSKMPEVWEKENGSLVQC